MKYTKPALTFDQQAQQLLDRGLIAPDKATVVQCLRSVNYYRLSAYWFPFRRIDPATNAVSFAPGTTLETIWRRYAFDRELRLIVMDAIERVEVAILRTLMVEQFTCQNGPFGYTQPASFSPGFPPSDFTRLLSEVDDAVKHSREEFVAWFRGEYTSEPRLPLWMAVEVMTFGQLFTMFRYLHRNEQQALAQQFGIFPNVFESWLHTLNFIRNACAHHARLWNREIPLRPKIPDKKHDPDWHTPVQFDNKRIFAVLTLLRYLLRYIDSQCDWQQRIENLLQAYPEIPLNSMGFPANWQDCLIWKK